MADRFVFLNADRTIVRYRVVARICKQLPLLDVDRLGRLRR